MATVFREHTVRPLGSQWGPVLGESGHKADTPCPSKLPGKVTDEDKRDGRVQERKAGSWVVLDEAGRGGPSMTVIDDRAGPKEASCSGGCECGLDRPQEARLGPVGGGTLQGCEHDPGGTVLPGVGRGLLAKLGVPAHRG